MKRVLFVINCLTICFFAETTVFSQNITYNSAIEEQLYSVFEELELERVPTGYLLDRAMELVDFSLYNGQSLNTDNIADFETFINGFRTMNSARVNNNGQLYNVGNIINAFTDSTAVELGAAEFKYNYIVNNAIANNLISVEDGQLFDVYQGGIWQNPYDSTRSFVFAASLPAHVGNSVRFKILSNQLYFSEPVSKIEFDAGDNVYHSISIPCDTTVTYLTTGDKELKLKVSFSGGFIMEGHSKIRILNPSSALSNNDIGPEMTIQMSTTSSYGEYVSALVSYRCSSIHGAQNVQKPFIFVEGFDDRILGALPEFFAKKIDTLRIVRLLKNQSYGGFDFEWLYNQSHLPSKILDEYDIFYVDWANPRADIRSNAELLKNIINQINTIKHNCGSTEKNTIVGHSMGGLVARYALCSMEEAGLPHETAYYVSYDSPQLGVNVPIGAQHAVRDIHKLLFGDNEPEGVGRLLNEMMAVGLYDVLDCPAAKQMMYYYVNQYDAPNPNYHVAWQDTLDRKGFPKGDITQKIENLAIVNGGALYPSPNQDILEFEKRNSLFEIDFSVSRNYGGGCVVSQSFAKYKKIKDILNMPWVTLMNHTHTSPAGSMALDIIPSSTLLGGDISDIPGLTYNGPIAFVPVSSALAAKNDSSGYSFGYDTPPIPLIDSPFNSFYINRTLQRHERIHGSYWEWLYNQSHFSLSGPDDFALSGDVFYTTGTPPPYSTPTWSVSDSGKASISGGVLTVSSPSVQTIYYCQRDTCAFYYKEKTVLAGFPSVTLWPSFGQSGEVTVHASCDDSSLGPVVDTLLQKGVLSCKWRLLKTSGQVEVQNTQSRSLIIDNSQDEYASVGFQLFDAVNYSTDTTRISVSNTISLYGSVVPFNYDPQSITVRGFGYVIDYQTISNPIIPVPEDDPLFIYMQYMSSNYFVVWKSSSNSNIPAPDSIMIRGQSLPLVDIIQESINGQPTDLFCFKILDSTIVQSEIQRIRQEYGNSPVGAVVPIQICRDHLTIQTVLFLIVPDERPEPQPL